MSKHEEARNYFFRGVLARRNRKSISNKPMCANHEGTSQWMSGWNDEDARIKAGTSKENPISATTLRIEAERKKQRDLQPSSQRSRANSEIERITEELFA